MALSSKSLILYGFEITSLNRNLDFKASAMGPELTAVLNLGFYSATSLLLEIKRAMEDADPSNTYTGSIDRTLAGGTQNRISIETNGAYLDLLFATGTNVNTSVFSLIGFNGQDYTGATEYTGAQTTGISLIPDYLGYNYLDDKSQRKVFGSVNVAASGLKEAITFNIQKFIDVEYRFEPSARLSEWANFFNWAIQQKPFDFTPEILSPDTVYEVTLEKTSYDGKGMGYRMAEMLPNFPNFYQTGPLNLRIIEESQMFL